MKKLKKNGHHFINIDHKEKFQITNPQSLGLHLLSVDGNRISVSANMKKLKNGCHVINIDHKEKFQIANPSKFGSLIF